MRALGKFLGAVLLTAVTTGCTPTLSSLGGERGDSATHADRLPIESALRERAESLKSLRGLYAVRVSRDGRTESFRYAVNVDREGRLRLEILPTTAGYALGAVVVTPGSFTMLDAGRRIATTGSDERSALARMLAVSLSARDVFEILAGVFAPSDEVSIWHRRGKSAGWYLETKRGLVSALVTPDGVPEVVVFSDPFQERESVVARYEMWRDVSGSERAMKVPARIVLTLPEHEVEVMLVARALEVNIPLPDERFVLEIPPSYSEEQL